MLGGSSTVAKTRRDRDSEADGTMHRQCGSCKTQRRYTLQMLELSAPTDVPFTCAACWEDNYEEQIRVGQTITNIGGARRSREAAPPT